MLTPFETIAAFIVLALLLLWVRFAYLDNKRTRKDINVRNSNQKDNFKINFDSECREFIRAMNAATEFGKLLKIKADIDDFLGERPFIPNEYYLVRKVYNTYYAMRQKLMPQAGNSGNGIIKTIA